MVRVVSNRMIQFEPELVIDKHSIYYIGVESDAVTTPKVLLLIHWRKKIYWMLNTCTKFFFEFWITCSICNAVLISKCRVSELAVISDVLRKYIDPEQADPVHKQRLGPDMIAHLWDNTIFQNVCLELPCAGKTAHACITAIPLLVMQQFTAVFYPWKVSKSLNFLWLL